LKIVFLPEADADIDRPYYFLVSNNPLAALKAMQAIERGIDQLKGSPRIGLAMKERPDVRELFIPFGKSAYVLRYRIDEHRDTIVVIRVWHGREART
jgi:plasmid stabilization system protein ParE